MTESHESRTGPDVRIEFRTDPDDDTRQGVEKSVRAMAAHSAELTARARAVSSGGDELTALVDDALRRQINSDPGAAAALAEILDRPLGPEFEPGSASPRVVGASPPYDYHWSWHDLNGAAQDQMILDDAAAHAALYAKSGLGGAGTFVNAHAGFGIGFRANGSRVMRADSGRRVTFGYVAGAKGFGSNATVEGGLDCTVFENGRFMKGDSRRIFRRRASVNETFVVNPGAWVLDSSMPLEFPAVAGRDYNFNVGVWVYTDNTSGVGVSAAKSLCQVLVESMWVA
ncbi:hypothetical protein [Streptomyces sp. SID8352]|uniref:hypothetical protein n=1 Tax=Streptomyces sp. SID8352 TaxID=2690338 RepID=UPI00136A4EF2|nr:hypothetical protein [Streptomyces sp. SID8352]MYU21796.1 hypothetical protein [Streptomyces sp. SID8352]